MAGFLMLTAYSLAYFLALLVILPFEYMKRPSALRGTWLRERFGLYETRICRGKTLWLHAVSVGEAATAVPLIKTLKQRFPSLNVVVSTVTDTGRKVASERLGDIARIVYVPFDLPCAAQNAFRRIRPDLLIIMETELWPVLLRTAAHTGTPVLVMNGRISDRSFRGYRKIRILLKRALKDVSLFCMQETVYAERIAALGAARDKIKTIGSLKFDTRPSSPVPAWAALLKGHVIIAGSTHETEEDLVIDAYAGLLKEFPDLNLIVAPRHPERFGPVEELITRKGFKCVKRSDLAQRQHAGGEPVQPISGAVVLLDAVGELASVYGAADIAVMGGSFIPHGGQNPLEPAYWSKAIVTGPHMENFPFMAGFYSKEGALQTGPDNLCETLRGLLKDTARTKALGLTARDLYEKNSGAVQRAVTIIEGYLVSPGCADNSCDLKA